jgi:hypothetical protein
MKPRVQCDLEYTLHLYPVDNIVLVLQSLLLGMEVRVHGENIKICDFVPYGHKVAVSNKVRPSNRLSYETYKAWFPCLRA